jgi:hypothetical protein
MMATPPTWRRSTLGAMTLDFAPLQSAVQNLAREAAADDSAHAHVEADLKTQLAAALAEIERLKHQSGSGNRFPGDPGPGKAIFGVAVTGMNRTMLGEQERAAGSKLAFRQYDNSGISDLAVPNGPVATRIKRDHAEGRVPVVSPKPGMAALANHQYGPQLEAFAKWCEAQPGITILIVHHEPENDQGFTGASYAEGQRWVRTCINKGAGGKPKKLMFIASLMTYAWTPEGRAKFGDPNLNNPGKQADGTHVWDMVGLDHYEGSPAAKTLLTKKWTDAVASIKAWGSRVAITELGVVQSNPNGGAVLSAFLDELHRLDAPVILYYSSAGGAGGKPQPNPDDWWVLTNRNGTMPAFAEAIRNRGVNPNA